MGYFTQILLKYGKDVTWWKRQPNGSYITRGTVKAIILALRKEEIFVEAGYTESDYQTIYTDKDLAQMDRVTLGISTFDVLPIQHFENSALGESYYTGTIRRRKT